MHRLKFERIFTRLTCSITISRQRCLTALSKRFSTSICCSFEAPNHSQLTTDKVKVQPQVYEVRERRIASFKEEWVRILSEHGASEPLWSVKWIVQHVLRENPLDKSVATDLQLSVSQEKEANRLLNERIQRVPVQYIIGEWDFRTVTLTMRPPVFIPEPETEVLVDLVLKACYNQENNKVGRKDKLTFLDLCCGSGAIAVSLLRENSNLIGYAIDQSEEAIALTEENAHRNKVSDRLHVYCSTIDKCADLFHNQLGVFFDFIISNPPYIPTADLPYLQPEITKYYDTRALDGGKDGLKFIKETLSMCRHVLKCNGQLWLESGYDQGPDIQDLLLRRRESWEMIYKSNLSDHLGRKRFHHMVRQ